MDHVNKLRNFFQSLKTFVSI